MKFYYQNQTIPHSNMNAYHNTSDEIMPFFKYNFSQNSAESHCYIYITPCWVSTKFHLQRDDSSIPMKWNYYNISSDDMADLHHHPRWSLLWSDDGRLWSSMMKLRARWWRVGIIDNNYYSCERWNAVHLEVGDGNLSKTDQRFIIQIFTWGHRILKINNNYKPDGL